MDAEHINQTFDLVSYAGGMAALRKIGAYFIGPCPICGGRDRFQVKRTAGGDMWICRKCQPDKYHSALDFLMAYHKESFTESLKRAGGDFQKPQSEPRTGKPVTNPAPVQVLPENTWQAEARQQVDAANNRLMDDPGEAAREYLTARGISRGAIFMNTLGLAIVYKRPAIVIPWLDVGEIITAVKYRFIDDLARNDKSKRFAMMPGSIPYLFGLQHVLPSDSTLLFVEGELNAVSVLQTLPRGVSVISAGSEGNGNAALLQALASHYSRVVIWTDQPNNARIIKDRMQRNDALLLKSPVIDGKKWDANEMLQAGLLADFIQLELSAECLGIPAPVAFQTDARISKR